jgi:hypothetical protein
VEEDAVKKSAAMLAMTAALVGSIPTPERLFAKHKKAPKKTRAQAKARAKRRHQKASRKANR